MLGYSVSYFLSQYWRNTPLYAEKIIPLLDTCLSNNFVYSDKVAGAFYELINKYQNTAELPLENLKEFIRENGYGYILDLMIQDEENIKLLWYLLVLIHQLKGSKEGLELVLSLFQDNYILDTINMLTASGEPTESHVGTFLSGKGPNIFFDKLNVAGACPNVSNGTFTYHLPEGNYINEEGTYIISWNNLSYLSQGKFNRVKIIAERLNLIDTIIYDSGYLPFTYPAKTYTSTFTFNTGDSPINALRIEYDCDFYNKIGACMTGLKITKSGTTYIPIENGTIESDGNFFEGYDASHAFDNLNIVATAPTSEGTIVYDFAEYLDAGKYTLKWDLLGADPSCYINNISVALRYANWNPLDAEPEVNTMSICEIEDIPYTYNNKEFSIDFNLLQEAKSLVFKYEMSDVSTSDSAKAYLSNLKIIKNTNRTVIKSIPNMTSATSPKGRVTSNGTFSNDSDDYKMFNYTGTSGCTVTSNGYVKYTFEPSERPTAGDYIFTWCNDSSDNIGYLTSVDATVTYIDGTSQQIYNIVNLTSVDGRTRYESDFTATNTIKELIVNYTTTLNNNGVGGTIRDVNIVKQIDTDDSGSTINVWHETLPVGIENTFSVSSPVDISKTGVDFFNNFKNFVRNYVYPELEELKVKYSIEGAQTQQIYSISKIHYASTLVAD